MAFVPDPPFEKLRGDLIRSKDWNDAIHEVQRLDSAKVNKSGDTMSGPLTVQGALRADNSDLYFTDTTHNHTGIGNAPGFAAIENASNYGALMILGRSGTSKGRYVRLWDYLQVIGSMDITGNLGVGTDTIHNPQGWNRVLDVAGGPHARLNVRTTAGDVVTSVFSHDNWDGPRGVIGTESNHPLTFATAYTHRMTIGTNGNVGIATDPSSVYRLDVAGQAHASSHPTSSDMRLKKNVKPLSHVLDKVSGLRGVSFDWNGTYEALGRSTGQREIGVIAQEVQKVFPELVSTWGDENYLAIDYGRLTAVLIEAIKELNAKVEALQQQLNTRARKAAPVSVGS